MVFCLHLKKTVAETYRMLSGTYGEAALNDTTYREWIQRFKSGDFDSEGRNGGGKEKIFEDSELEALLAEDSGQVQEELAESLGVTQQAISKRLKAMEMIQKQGNWVPYNMLNGVSLLVNSYYNRRIKSNPIAKFAYIIQFSRLTGWKNLEIPFLVIFGNL